MLCSNWRAFDPSCLVPLITIRNFPKTRSCRIARQNADLNAFTVVLYDEADELCLRFVGFAG